MKHTCSERHHGLCKHRGHARWRDHVVIHDRMQHYAVSNLHGWWLVTIEKCGAADPVQEYLFIAWSRTHNPWVVFARCTVLHDDDTIELSRRDRVGPGSKSFDFVSAGMWSKACVQRHPNVATISINTLKVKCTKIFPIVKVTSIGECRQAIYPFVITGEMCTDT